MFRRPYRLGSLIFDALAENAFFYQPGEFAVVCAAALAGGSGGVGGSLPSFPLRGQSAALPPATCWHRTSRSFRIELVFMHQATHGKVDIGKPSLHKGMCGGVLIPRLFLYWRIRATNKRTYFNEVVVHVGWVM